MFYVKKTLEISASHKLELDYDSPCQNTHGHNWKIVIFCKAKELDQNGMVVDFAKLKKLVNELMDHKDLNQVFVCNSTAENIAYHLSRNISMEFKIDCYKVKVIESSNNEAVYER